MSLSKKEPVGNTCPLIDEVIKGIENAVKELNAINKVLDSYPIASSISEIENLHDVMEQIRRANTALRDWGADANDAIQNLEIEIDNIKNHERN